ncbi:MAG: MarC family protein [Desulfovibrionaceae bacterium]
MSLAPSEAFKTILEIALPLFLIMDPIGNAAICLPMLKDMPPVRQRRVLFRELCIALCVTLLFQFIGEGLLGLLDIEQSTLRVAGGCILFIISVRMVFPPATGEHPEALITDPFIVPIAVPLIAGPSLLAAVMVYAHRGTPQTTVGLAVLLAWGAAAVLMLSSPSLLRVLGKRGMRAAERLMGLILVLMSVQMLEEGVRLFILSFTP